MSDYLRVTRSGTYGFLAALPLLVGYEVLMCLSNPGSRVSAGVFVKEVLWTFGLYGHLAFGLAVLILGVIVAIRERDRQLPLRAGYFVGMVGEAICWAPVFALVVMYLTVQVAPPAAAEPQLALWPLAGAGAGGATATAGGGALAASPLAKIGLALGAGVYEEFVFRVLLVGGTAWLVRLLFPRLGWVLYPVAVVAGALVFSLAHYIGSQAYDFTLASFLFRFLGGVLLNALYLTRGFGIAAWTHAIYDIMVLLHSGG